MADRSMHPADTTPVLVVYMSEHAFAIHYSAVAAKYIDAFSAKIQRDAVVKSRA